MRGVLPLTGTSYHKKNKSPANQISTFKFRYMAYIYINPRVVASTAELLRKYKKDHPKSVTPMADALAGGSDYDKERYVRAARKLGWRVVKSLGRVYENGVLVW